MVTVLCEIADLPQLCTSCISVVILIHYAGIILVVKSTENYGWNNKIEIICWQASNGHFQQWANVDIHGTSLIVVISLE